MLEGAKRFCRAIGSWFSCEKKPAAAPLLPTYQEGEGVEADIGGMGSPAAAAAAASGEHKVERVVTSWGAFKKGFNEPLKGEQRTAIEQNLVRDQVWGTTTLLQVGINLAYSASFWVQNWGQTVWSGAAIAAYTIGKGTYYYCRGKSSEFDWRKASISGLGATLAVPVWNIMQYMVGPKFGAAVYASNFLITYVISSFAAGCGEGPIQQCTGNLNLCWKQDRQEYLEDKGICNGFKRVSTETALSIIPGCGPGAIWNAIGEGLTAAGASSKAVSNIADLAKAVGGGAAISAGVGAGNYYFTKFMNGINGARTRTSTTVTYLPTVAGRSSSSASAIEETRNALGALHERMVDEEENGMQTTCFGCCPR